MNGGPKRVKGGCVGLAINRRWEVAMGRGIDMVSTVGGDFAVEEDRKCWLGTMVFSFRIMTSSLEAMEAWVMAKRS